MGTKGPLPSVIGDAAKQKSSRGEHHLPLSIVFDRASKHKHGTIVELWRGRGPEAIAVAMPTEAGVSVRRGHEMLGEIQQVALDNSSPTPRYI